MQLRAGVIGLGVGEAHLQTYASHPSCRVTKVSDFSSEKLEQIKTKYPHVNVTQNAHEVLQDPDIDIVSIASYDCYHFGQIITALNHKKHVFVEKPVCLHRDEAVKIYELLKKKPSLYFSCNMILRKSPRFIFLKEMMEQKKFGDLYYIEGDYFYGRLNKLTGGWRGKMDFYSITYGGGVHLVDLLLWLTESQVFEVYSYSNKIASRGSQFQYDDFVTTLLKFKNGLLGKVSSNFGCVRPHFHGLSIFGTEATFVNDVPHAKLYQGCESSAVVQEINTPYPGVDKGALLFDFINAIVKGTKPLVTIDEIMNAMAVCFAIEEAAKTEKPTPVQEIG